VARPLIYYELHLDVVILVLNITSCVFRILGSILLFIIAGNLRTIDEFLQSQLITEPDTDTNDAYNNKIFHSRNQSSNFSQNNKNSSNAINTNQSLESENKEENSMERLPATYKLDNNSIYLTPSSGLLGRMSDSDRENTANITKPTHNRAHSSSVTSNKFSSDLYYKRIVKE
jgi:hypothetical protein